MANDRPASERPLQGLSAYLRAEANVWDVFVPCPSFEVSIEQLRGWAAAVDGLAGHASAYTHVADAHCKGYKLGLAQQDRAPASERPNLHAAIMNLPFTLPASGVVSQGYLKGHEDARHAAAELVLADRAASAPQVVRAEAERHRFEDHIRETYKAYSLGHYKEPDFSLYSTGDYNDNRIELQWRGWLARARRGDLI